MFFFDPYYLIFILPAIILMLIAQWRVNAAYNKWMRVPNQSGIAGRVAAQRLLGWLGLYDVQLETTPGHLTDHYDPAHNVLRLSRDIGNEPSVASLAVVAHELGHAMQDQEGYLPLKFRSAIVPAVSVGSYLGWILILAGILLRITGVAWLGVAVFSGGALFALVTLPVEFNASRRALRLLTDNELIVTQDEERGVRAVLNAAAMTYVAALATALFQLLYYTMLIGGLGRRRD